MCLVHDAFNFKNAIEIIRKAWNHASALNLRHFECMDNTVAYIMCSQTTWSTYCANRLYKSFMCFNFKEADFINFLQLVDWCHVLGPLDADQAWEKFTCILDQN